ncbi:MAG: rRNA (uracil1939-C5)-methyltransferase [Alphaproteobacteria bacterium]|jgi:23S rRNA (uracil1939-C5)-methyltransferase|nr:rRNA (uracil1939-C5)-methyltransferase [Alphaproteobacteria bacterium]
MSETVKILQLGHAGDGITEDGLFVPYTVPGDVVRVIREGARGRLQGIVTLGPSRAEPVCSHFGRCGGCALQMVAREPYLAWKRESVLNALKQRGFTDVPVEEIRAVPPGTRRRAMFKARDDSGCVALGFYEPDSRRLVDISECPVLVPALARLIGPLKAQLAQILKPNEMAELHATATETGVDLSLKIKRPRRPDLLMALSELASSLKLARLNWNGETVAMAATPAMSIGRFTVALPPESFLQPTKEGEAILQGLVREEAGSARRIADLFSGCGTFALDLAEGRAIHSVDSAEAQIDALAGAAKAGRANLTAETRDLFRRPLLASELARFDAVVLDPPRPGAAAQVQALAQSVVPTVLYVSCNPASFARDARILADGGYRLTRVVPLDQFLWSPHVELFARFVRD